jgi:predicted nucleic acid-binding protein
VDYLLDTNVLVYAQVDEDPAKQEQAITLLDRLARSGNAALPAQALAEFCRVGLDKLRPEPSPEVLSAQVEDLRRAFEVLPLTGAVVLEALRGVAAHKLSYFDAQIWAVARLNQVPVVLSEDFSHGAILDGVEFLDPFRSDFPGA